MADNWQHEDPGVRALARQAYPVNGTAIWNPGAQAFGIETESDFRNGVSTTFFDFRF